MNEPMGRQEQQGHPCPECGALRAQDNTPSCACAERVSEALLDTRTAEAAAAEDFNPLRIRPYVEIGEAGAGSVPADADVTMQLRAVEPAADATMPPHTVDRAALPTPLAPPVSAPSANDLSLFEGADGEDRPEEAEPRGRWRRGALLAAATCAVVAVVATAGFAGGVFSYEAPTRNTAAPEDVRAAVPRTSTSGAASVSASASESASPASASPSPSPSESASPSASESASSASPSRSAEPTRTAPTASESTGQEVSPEHSTTSAATLHRGNKGPEVAELQARLRQLYLYNSDINGSYNEQVEDAVKNFQWSRGIQSDKLGEYGPATRARLEAETNKP